MPKRLEGDLGRGPVHGVKQKRPMQPSTFEKRFKKPKKGSAIEFKWLGAPVQHPIFAGYAVKGLPYLGGPKFPGVTRICSVSDCIRKGAVDANPWDLNRLSLYGKPQDAWATVPQDARSNYELLAFDIYPEIYRLGLVCTAIEVPTVNPLPLPSQVQFLGYDTVTYGVRSWTSNDRYFGALCSSLSCNGRANEIPVNQFCLLACYDDAVNEARTVSASRGTLGEPGDYAVYGVYAVPPP